MSADKIAAEAAQECLNYIFGKPGYGDGVWVKNDRANATELVEKAIERALSQSLAARDKEMDWQPIGTVPLFESVLAWHINGFAAVCTFQRSANGYSHWMPLPSAPALLKGKAI